VNAALPVGCYRDTISERGIVRWQAGGWRHNVIVSSAWPLVTALLRKEPNALGISFCAVGEGDPAWDSTPPQPSPETLRLRREIARAPVGVADMRYIDAAGRPAQTWTHRLELTVVIPAAPNPRQVREFGLVGGDATGNANSGRLINYAVHPVIELRANQTLTRTIRLNFRPGGSASGEQAGGVPMHWLGDQPVTLIDGVGDTVATALKDTGVDTVRELATLKLDGLPKGVSRSRAVELRAKAQLAMQTAVQLVRAPSFNDKTIDDVLSATPDESVPVDTLGRLQGQLGLLQVALDARWLKRRTMADLLASHAP
jgi:hypothetical protein